jgi:hypothetical protein
MCKASNSQVFNIVFNILWNSAVQILGLIPGVALWQWNPRFGIRDLGKILVVTGPASVAYPNRSLQDCGQRLMEQQEELLVEISEQPDVPQRQDFCSVSAIVVSQLP